MTEMLEFEGFDAVWAKNGQVAIDYLKPVMNGKEFFRVKENNPRISRIPVVMMTANGHLVNMMDYVERAGGYMSKPMDYETVVKMVKHFLGNDPQLSQ